MPSNSPEQPKTPQGPTPQEFLEKVDDLGKEMGYGLAPSIEPYLQDNGAYAFKAKINIVKVDKQ